MTERDFQIWIDWMVKDGELEPGQLTAQQIYTNEFSSFGAPPAVTAPEVHVE